MYITDPLYFSGERVRFYMPIIADPRSDRGGTMFAGLQSIWRTTDNGGNQTFLENFCNESSTAPSPAPCGAWERLGNGALTNRTVSIISRTTGDKGTLWAGTDTGRLYIFKNADAPIPANAIKYEVSDALGTTNTTPVRFISGIAIDPLNPNHGWVSYSGYNAGAPLSQNKVFGHVFEVTWDGSSPRATFTPLDGTGAGALGDLPINALVRDDTTGDLFAATDFAVLRRDARSGYWTIASPGMPMVEVSSLAIDQRTRVLYAATHGRGAWRLRL